MRYLLGRIVVMRDLTSAIAAANRFHHRFKIVTLDGQVMNAGGSMTGGSVARSRGLPDPRQRAFPPAPAPGGDDGESAEFRPPAPRSYPRLGGSRL